MQVTVSAGLALFFAFGQTMRLCFCAAHICLQKWRFPRLPAGVFDRARPMRAKTPYAGGDILRVCLC